MKRRIWNLWKYPAAFFLTFLLLTALLVGAACVPRQRIRQNMLKSAETMCETRTQFLITSWIRASQIDRYADSITLSIAYHLDENAPLQSAMTASCRGYQHPNANQVLLQSVRGDLPATQEYLRYWHGSAALMRILHLFWDIQTVYRFHGILMAALCLVLVLLLVKHNLRGEAAGFLLSMILVSVWYVPLCLEYTYAFLCMLAASLLGVWLALRGRESWFGGFFLVTGMVTVYFDFLTAETLSLTVPLLLILRVWSRQGKTGGQMWARSVQCGAAWGAGYLGMWAMKWALASLVLGENVMPFVRSHVTERLSGAVAGIRITGNAGLDMILLNLRKLFPFEYGLSGAVLFMAFQFLAVFLPVFTGRVVRKTEIRPSKAALFFALSLLPYVRFLILRNHSYIHSFFTYRALAASALAVCCLVLELVEPAPRKAVILRGQS